MFGIGRLCGVQTETVGFAEGHGSMEEGIADHPPVVEPEQHGKEGEDRLVAQPGVEQGEVDVDEIEEGGEICGDVGRSHVGLGG